MEIFSAINVTKNYTAHRALDKVSIGVPGQSIFGLLGPNGAGKTTLIRIINRIIAPDEGDLMFDGKPLGPDHLKKIGYLPEERGLYKKMKVGEQALYLAQLKGLSRIDAQKKLKVLFEKFEMGGWWNRKVEELSKGMQQKVQFIVTIVHEPVLLIFDEPFSGFDPINVNLLKEEILALKKNGSTIIFSTHNMASVEELCDHIALINNSRKILDGNIRSIRNTFKTSTFEVSYHDFEGSLQTFLDPSYTVLYCERDHDNLVARIQVPTGQTTNDLLHQLMPHVLIASLKEIIPSMNEIFIRAVTEKNPSSTNQNTYL